MAFYNLSINDALKKLNSSDKGLSRNEAKKRQKKYGKNVIKVKTTPLWKKLLAPLMDIFTLILAIAATISFFTDAKFDAIIILIIIAVSAVIYYVQTFSTEKALKSLSRYDAQKVSVIRGGRAILLDSAELVPGDVISLGEGEKIPADLRIIDATNLRVDESQLTGESLPIEKHDDEIQDETPIYEQANMAFQGSFVVSGTLKGLVVATANDTEFGNIASLSAQSTERSPVQKKIDNLITKIIAVVSAVALVVFGLAIYRGMEVLEALRFVMAIAVSAIPESLPIAISVILVLGMRRMAKRKALVHQMRAIETIGLTTTIATDKTGTLTQNKLSVQEIWSPTGSDLTEAIAHSINKGSAKNHDPLDRALDEFSRQKKISTRGTPAAELPFDQATAMSANVWHHGSDYKIYLKGAPEQIIKKSKLTKSAKSQADKALKSLTEMGYRVVGIASLDSKKLIEKFEEIKTKKLTLEGFVAVADSLRPEAKKAISQAKNAGVLVRMITGDHFETAYQIGKQLDLVSQRDEVFDCREMDKLSAKELDKIVERTKVFSRVIPKHKYKILEILKKHNITTMTGDGVNDVPALSSAHVGVAMGSGSQIARDAGAIVLLDDNFKTIIEAIREGRTIIANIRRMLFYLLSTNAGELIIIISSLLIGSRTPIEPIQILWINLVTDTSMAIPLGLEPAEKNVMKNPPRKPNSPIMDRFMIVRMILVASTMTVLTLGVYTFFNKYHGHEYAQTMAFLALVVTQWANAFNARSDHESIFTRIKTPNKSFYVGLIASIVIQSLVFITPLGDFMHVTAVSQWHMIVISAISFVVPIAVSEIHKFKLRKQNSN